MTSTMTADIEVDAPIRAVYDQWTQFEDFPQFMGSVNSITQTTDDLTHWTVSIGGVEREFDAEIVDQVPDDHVEWASTGERVHTGRVAFTPVTDDRTRVELRMEWEPETFVEKAGAGLNLDEAAARMDLERFKSFIEERGRETGGWRGEIHNG
ncbi:SRPBCC family protein [Microbacterium sp. bgisy207]|uniref:SRPBCC family protein n=1 Tax=Microbacterium sp. bgisy207 TaxID=3413800 RepID=UPI003EBCEE8D